MRALAALLLVAIAACIQGNRPPEVAPRRTLSLGTGEAKGARTEPFRVVYAAPRGQTAAVSQLSLVFSRPLRSLGTAESEATPPIKLQPAIPGRWQWVGTRAVVFVPAGGRLPGATRVRVEVPASTRALDGSTLGKPYRFALTTPLPRLVRSEPWDGARGLVPPAKLELRFNQPIDPAVLERLGTLSAAHSGGRKLFKRLAFRVEQPDPAQPKRLVIRPVQRLPVHSRIRFSIARGLSSTEGPLVSKTPEHVGFETYGPLSVVSLECPKYTPHGRCEPGSVMSISLSTPVKMRDLERAVSVSPPVKLQWGGWEDDVTTRYVSLVGGFRPAHSYTIHISGKLRDRYGQKLDKSFTQRMQIDDFWPDVEIGLDGQTLEPTASRPIPIGSLNTPAYRLLTARLHPDALPALLEDAAPASRFDRLASLAGVRSKRIRPGGLENRMSLHNVDPASVLGGRTRRGAIAIGVSYNDGRNTRERRLFRVVQVTDLAISAKVSHHGSVVWVTRLSDAAPVRGAKVRVVGLDGLSTAAFRTDKRGLVTIPKKAFDPDFGYRNTRDAVIVAEKAGDWCFRRVGDYIGSWRTGVPMDLSGDEPQYGMMFTERGLYRPGDSVRVKAIVRRQVPGGNAIVAGQTLHVELHSPKGDKVAEQAVTTLKFGTFSLRFKLPRSAALGSWSLVTRGLDEGRIGRYFKVAEYRPAEFKVGVESDKPAFIRGDTAHWTVHGDYLFGSPMSHAAARIELTHTPTWFSPPGSDGFVTDATAFYMDLDDESNQGGSLRSKKARLDRKGQASLGMKLSLPAQRGPELVTAEAEVTDVSRQSLSGSTSAIVHPGRFYIGIRQPKDYFVNAPGQVETGIVALSPTGVRLAGRRVRVALVRRRWTLARQGAGARMHALSRPVDTEVGHCDVTTRAGGAAPCTLTFSQGGYYLIHATARDSRGNSIESAESLYGIGAGGPSWGDSDQLRVDLALDKKEYRVGDTARVLIKSPFPDADALVTVEAASVHYVRRVHVHGATPTVRVPVTAALGPNAFVSVHLLRGRTHAPPTVDAPDVGAPAYRVGYAELDVDPAAHRLKVRITPSRRNLEPGGNLKVDVVVTNAAGRPEPSEVTLYAVDEGVLSLIDYKTPDPVPVFTSPRPLGVATIESRESLATVDLADLAGVLGQEKGNPGGGGSDGTPARHDFRQSAYFNPAVLTGADGHAHVSFKLPESLTTYRLMAIVVSKRDRYGFGESRVTTSKRLMARPALPRFLRAGDSIDAGVIVSTKKFGPTKVEVRASVQGLTLSGAATRTVEVGRNDSVEVRFPMRAPHVGGATLRFDVSAEGEHDAVRVKRKVQVPAAMEAVALYGRTNKAASEKLGNLARIRRDVGKLSISLSSTALVGLGSGVDQLVQYPYGCTEQLSSRLMPLLPLRDLAHDFSIKLPSDLDQVVDKTVAKILQRQHGDGGFGLWPDSPRSLPWVSAYALWTLDQAHRRGELVPSGALERGTAYVRRYLSLWRDDKLFASTAAFMLDVLAEMGQPDAGYMSQLYDRRAKLPLFARALLLHAMAISKQKPAMVHELEQNVQNQLRISGDTATVAENVGDDYAVLMDSPVRTSAMVLRALLAVQPHHPLAARLARGLLRARHGGTWRSTQETAYALLALDEYRKAQEAAKPDYVARVWLGGKQLMSTAMRGRSASAVGQDVAASKLGSGSLLVFDKAGRGSLFYQARLRYAPLSLPSTSLDRGFYVQKTLRRVSPEDLRAALRTIPEVGTKKFAAGDLVLADLVIVTPSPREYVAIDDPLPAGFEGVDAGLATTASWLDVPGSGGEPGRVSCVGCTDSADDAIASGRAFLSSWYRREVRDDRVVFFVDHMAAGIYHYRYLARATTAGSFVEPPTKAEEMYTPEVFGRTAAMRVEVQ